MTYELTEKAKEEFTWIERRRIQLSQLLVNIATIWIAPDNLEERMSE